MDLQNLTLPVILAMVIGKVLKSHENVPNRTIPFVLFGVQLLEELAKQLQSASAPDLAVAAAAAVPVVAGAVLAHQSGKGLLGAAKQVLPVLRGVLGVLKAVIK